MPRIFDNIELKLLPALQSALTVSHRGDFCVGYFNLRGWRNLDKQIEEWSGGAGECCRLLVGMQRLPEEDCRIALGAMKGDDQIDNATALRLKRRLAEEFRTQLMLGTPTNEDEAGLRRLAAQIKQKKVVVKLFLRHPLHAKLYLLFRKDANNPATGFVGSSNLTMSGLANQGELNVDVLDHDACDKLAKWFEDRWNDRFSVDISDELVAIIEESWARTELIPPYHIYLKIAFHLSKEAQDGLKEFRIPAIFGNELFDFQVAAVKIAAGHLNKRHGVVIGDVVGLGKTLMASAVAKVFEEDQIIETLIICPKNLTAMWEDYRLRYGLRAKVISLTQVEQILGTLQRFRQVIIDESHNLRNREGKRYKAIREYIEKNDPQVILLSATPYNKSYDDLSSQLRLFLPEDKNIGVRPERKLREMGEIEFARRHQCHPKTLAAFEKSEYPDDWRELMRLYLVRRTRSFIKQHYALYDCPCGLALKGNPAKCPKCDLKVPAKSRKYILYANGERSYFPERKPLKAVFTIDERNPKDQYARLFSDEVVTLVNDLQLPRYGLGNYAAPGATVTRTDTEQRQLDALSRAGKRLMGFCRTNLFKRLESSGQAFMQSIERHILRNFVFLHAINSDLPLPLGTQDNGLLDPRLYDEDDESGVAVENDDDNNTKTERAAASALRSEIDFQKRAADVYALYASQMKKRFKWIRPALFIKELKDDLLEDAKALLRILDKYGVWNPEFDAKLDALHKLITQEHSGEKVLIFTQFADTVRYITGQLKGRGVKQLEGVTGDDDNPTDLAHRFSPVSNKKDVPPGDQLRVLMATDVLSEGQNLQDAHIVVNFDLPWAIIRLIQRAGRVDRIGQKAEVIKCYSFIPADGVERIINLRGRVRQRLRQNAEVVGADEQFFEDDHNDLALWNLYNETSEVLDGDDETEVDLSSYAYQIWKDAIDLDPTLAKKIEDMPNVVYSTKAHKATDVSPHGVLVYVKTNTENNSLVWVDKNGKSASESQLAILQAAKCEPDTPALQRQDDHHELVAKGVVHVNNEEKSAGSGLGRPSGARFKTYERLKRFLNDNKNTTFVSQEFLDKLGRALEELLQNPLRSGASDRLNRQLRTGVTDDHLAELVVQLRDENMLCQVDDDKSTSEPHIICSLGLAVAPAGGK